MEVTFWHFSFGKVDLKFTFPPQFLLVPEKRKINKFEPCSLIVHFIQQDSKSCQLHGRLERSPPPPIWWSHNCRCQKCAIWLFLLQENVYRSLVGCIYIECGAHQCKHHFVTYCRTLSYQSLFNIYIPWEELHLAGPWLHKPRSFHRLLTVHLYEHSSGSILTTTA